MSPKSTRAVPFNEDRMFRLMREADANLLLVSSRHNTRYLTGGYYYPLYMWDGNTKRTQHLSFLGVPRDRLEDAFFVGRPGEREILQDAGVWVGNCVDASAIGSLASVERLVAHLAEHKLTAGRVAVELATLPAEAYLLLSRRLPSLEFVDAASILDPLRAVKSVSERTLMQKGTGLLLDAVNDVLQSLTDGETTESIAARVSEAVGARGLHSLYALICAGPSFFRAPSRNQRYRKSCPVHIDSGALVDGYVVEVCRMGILGSPAPLVQELFEGCVQLERHMLQAIRPGITGSELHRYAKRFLEGHRYGENGKFIAHGIGMVHHEDPVINSSSEQALEAGMVISIEMEFRHEQAGHIKLEDMIAVTEDGNEVMSPGADMWNRSPR